MWYRDLLGCLKDRMVPRADILCIQPHAWHAGADVQYEGAHMRLTACVLACTEGVYLEVVYGGTPRAAEGAGVHSECGERPRSKTTTT